MSDITADDTSGSGARKSHSLMVTLSAATLIQIVATASVLALTAIAPTVAADLGIGAYLIGYQISLIYASGMFSSAVAGTLVKRLGPVRVEQLALACFLLGFVGIAMAQVLPIIVASLLIGIGYGLNNPPLRRCWDGSRRTASATSCFPSSSRACLWAVFSQVSPFPSCRGRWTGNMHC